MMATTLLLDIPITAETIAPAPKDDDIFNALSFPGKIYSLLEDAETFGFQDVISWQAGGNSFKIHKPEVYERTIMQSYFMQTKFKSFQRQLNIYGFKLVQVGHNKGGYHHSSFVRGSPQLCANIVRSHRERKAPTTTSTRKTMEMPPVSSLDPLDFFFSGTTNSSSSLDEQGEAADDLFFKMTNVPQHQMMMKVNDQLVHHRRKSSSTMIQLEESEVSAFYEFFYPQGCDNNNRNRNSNSNSNKQGDDKLFMDTFFTEDPGCVTTGAQADDSQDWQFGTADLNEFISVLQQQDMEESQEMESSTSEQIMIMVEQQQPQKHKSQTTTNSNSNTTTKDKENCFPYKLHLMLENAKRDGYDSIVSWVKKGTAFKVHQPQAFVEHVLPMYFDQSKMESFRKQCNLYQFSRISKGVDRGVISHPFLVEGKRHLCEQIRNARHTTLFQQQQQQQEQC